MRNYPQNIFKKKKITKYIVEDLIDIYKLLNKFSNLRKLQQLLKRIVKKDYLVKPNRINQQKNKNH